MDGYERLRDFILGERMYMVFLIVTIALCFLIGWMVG